MQATNHQARTPATVARRLVTFITAATLVSLGWAAPVLGAAPTNDTYASRTVIVALPFTDAVDTTEAGTDADDTEANVDCGAPATDASVWYELTAPADGYYLVDVASSDYSAGVIVVSGGPGSFSIESCGPGALIFYGFAGQTYAILAFDDQEDGTGNGGNLALSVDLAPPPPTLAIGVDPVGHFNKDGSATVTGTAVCSGEAFFTEVDVQLTQRVGRFTITGYGSAFDAFVCDGESHPWSALVYGSNGLFKGGQTASVTVGYACGAFDCGFDFMEKTIKLRG